MFVADSPALRTRVGLVVPKHGRKIVERNRVKRRLREAARLELLPACQARDAELDILIQARPAAYEASYRELEAEVRQLARELCSRDS